MSPAALLAALALIPAQYQAADLSHDAARAQRVRVVATVVSAELARVGSAGAARTAARLRRTLATTRVRLQPWPLPRTVRSLSAATVRTLHAQAPSSAVAAKPYDEIDRLLTHAAGDASAGRFVAARAAAAGAYALFELGPGRRLATSNPALATQAADSLWSVVAAACRPAAMVGRGDGARTDVQTVATALGATPSAAPLLSLTPE